MRALDAFSWAVVIGSIVIVLCAIFIPIKDSGDHCYLETPGIAYDTVEKAVLLQEVDCKFFRSI